MQTRLQAAAGLLRPDGVLIITIDENEVHHLAVLLQQMFPDATHQTVTMVINPKGSHRRATFNRVNEYALFVFFDRSASLSVCRMADDLLTGDTNTGNQPVEQTKVRWPYLLHSGYGSLPHEAPGQVYPIAVDPQGRILATGRTLLERANADEIANYPDALDGYVPPAEELIQLGTETVWPVNRSGELSCWNLRPATLMERNDQGYVAATRNRKHGWSIKYLSTGLIAQIKSGDIKVAGNDPVTGSVILEPTMFKKKPMTVWHRSRHDAGRHGTEMLKTLLGDKRFNYPKSLYSTLDAIACVMSDRKNAVVLDFFAGSGTTLHAVAALNASDGGRRQCVLVSNNEVSPKTAERLRDNGGFPSSIFYYLDKVSSLAVRQDVVDASTESFALLPRPVTANPAAKML